MKKGLFIVIDGTDGSGKATQADLLSKSLVAAGHNTHLIDFPRYETNHVGRLIRECLDGKRGDFIGMDPKIASTLYAADRYESSGQIREHLEQGGIVIADRYVSANQMHQGGKISDPEKRKEFLVWLDDLEYGVFGIPKPDAILFLHVPVEVSSVLAQKRAQETGGEMDEAEKDLDHQRKSQEGALSIVKDSNNWIKVECTEKSNMRTREDIHAEIKTIVEKLYEDQAKKTT
jgi:dTMP kinase